MHTALNSTFLAIITTKKTQKLVSKTLVTRDVLCTGPGTISLVQSIEGKRLRVPFWADPRSACPQTWHESTTSVGDIENWSGGWASPRGLELTAQLWCYRNRPCLPLWRPVSWSHSGAPQIITPEPCSCSVVLVETSKLQN